MGGIIIRATIPLLKDYHCYFYNFITLSTPHLGVSFNSSLLMSAGLKIMESLNSSIALKQMSLRDSDQMD